MGMYIWEVALEVQWKQTWKEGKKEKYEFWEDRKYYTVAAESGKVAIAKAEKLALAEGAWTGEHINDDDTAVPSKETPYKVLDVVGLSLKQALDG